MVFVLTQFNAEALKNSVICSKFCFLSQNSLIKNWQKVGEEVLKILAQILMKREKMIIWQILIKLVKNDLA